MLPSATIVFFDNNGQQFLSIMDTYIGRQHADAPSLISLANYNTGNLLFGTLQHFTTTPPTIVATTLCMRIMGKLMQARYTRFHDLHGSCNCYTSQEHLQVLPSMRHATPMN